MYDTTLNTVTKILFQIIFIVTIILFYIFGRDIIEHRKVTTNFIIITISFGAQIILKVINMVIKNRKETTETILEVFPSRKASLPKDEFLTKTGFDFGFVNKYIGNKTKYYPADYLHLINMNESSKISKLQNPKFI